MVEWLIAVNGISDAPYLIRVRPLLHRYLLIFQPPLNFFSVVLEYYCYALKLIFLNDINHFYPQNILR